MDWLKQAIATVYKSDGLVGVVVVAALVGALLYFFGGNALELLK